jgi:hypothetical protein
MRPHAGQCPLEDQKLPRDVAKGAAALPPKAATTLADRRVRFGPTADIALRSAQK